MPLAAARAFFLVAILATAAGAHAQGEGESEGGSEGESEGDSESESERATESDWGVSLLLSGGAMVTNDQLTRLFFNGGGGSARLGLHARPFSTLGIDWIEGELRAGVTVVGPGGGEPGGVVDVQLGARIAPRFGDVRPYLAIGVGVGFTGPLTRGLGSAAVGVALYLGEEFTLAPEVTALHVVQDDGPLQSDDAVFVSFGLALTYRQVSHPPVVPDVPPATVLDRAEVREHEHVIREPAAPPPEPVVMEDLLSLVDLAVPGSTLSVVLLVPPLLFDHDESVLTAAGEVAMHDVLERVAEAPTARVVIEGHADVTGEPEHNLVLSRARAAVVGQWLVDHGIPRERLRETGEGATRPLVVGEDDLTLAPNRRVTIRLEMDIAPTTPVEPP